MTFLEASIYEFRRYKLLAEGAMVQVRDEDLHWQPDPESNSIAIIAKHLSGNMLSRWTEFLTTDGEKPDRNREGEFVDDIGSRAELMAVWERGWTCLFDALAELTNDDLQKSIFVRAEPLSVLQAIVRQISHYAYHVGQIVYIAKHLQSASWKTLSIARGKSAEYLTRGQYNEPRGVER